jgi:nitrogen regulatory protein PII
MRLNGLMIAVGRSGVPKPHSAKDMGWHGACEVNTSGIPRIARRARRVMKLITTGAFGVTVPEIKGFARQQEHRVIYRGVEYEGTYLPKVRIEVIVADPPVDAAIAVNRCGAPTTHLAGAKMYLPDVSSILRIRTGDIEEAAL